jgi:hypothetical protein
MGELLIIFGARFICYGIEEGRQALNTEAPFQKALKYILNGAFGM